MSVEKRARWCSFRSVYVATAFLAGLAACEQGTNEGPAAPTPKHREPDKTEVTMEVTPIGSANPNDPTAPPVASSASDGTGSGTADPSDDPNLGGPQEPAIEKAVGPIRPRIRACYKKALVAEPSLGGTATLDAVLNKDGRVSSVRMAKRDGLNEDMVGCLLTAMKSATFEGGNKSQVVTFSFGSPPSASGPSSTTTTTAVGADAGAKK